MSPKPRRTRTLDRLTVLTYAVSAIAVMLGGFTLWALRHILAPVALAAFLLLLIDGLARAIARRIPKAPSWAPLTAAVALIVLLFGSAIWLAADNGAAFAFHAPQYEHRLNHLLNQAAGQLDLGPSLTMEDLIHQVNPARFVGAAAMGLRDFTEGAIFVLVYLAFLIASRRGFGRKAASMFPDAKQRREVYLVFERIRTGVESYVLVQTAVGLIIASLSAILMTILGLPHVLFWAFIIFLANYIPVIGAAVGVLLPPLFGLVQFNDLLHPLVLLAGMETIHFAVAQVLQPRLQGSRLNLDPVVVVFALAFWALVWGVIGAVLSTPLTVIAMAILAEFSATRPLAVLLSGDGKPYADLEAASQDAERERGL
ncbi:MAG TPA: AI-2E family transporter [Caulobacteraceae bacterium]|nr:AI-2E family transporter [Caulobacteraceae bacterium]